MRKLLIAGVIVCSAISLRPQQTASVSDIEKGTWLFHACKAYIRSSDNALVTNPVDASLANECLDYLQGFNDGVALATPPEYCAATATSGTLVRVYVNYIESHPKLLDEHRALGLLLAIKDSYPCAKKK